MFGRELANFDQWPIFIARAPWPEHLQNHGLEQVVELLQVLFALGDQPFDLAEQMEYFVEAGGVRSPVFTLKVIELPYVQRLELEYRELQAGRA